jgi:pteridine reductase
VTVARPVALVTGGARRVGREIALRLAEAGHDVVIHYHRSVEAAHETVAAIEARGARAAAVAADLADAEAARAVPGRAHAVFGRLDVVVNSAASWKPVPLLTVSPQDWDDTFAVNLRAPFLIAIAAAPLLTPDGVIINLADHLATESSPGLVPHSVSKAGVVALTEQLAQQLAPRLRVNAVAPGAVLPPPGWSDEAQRRFAASTPLQRLGDPADVAEAIVFLVGARYITGVVLPVDGGRHLGR